MFLDYNEPMVNRSVKLAALRQGFQVVPEEWKDAKIVVVKNRYIGFTPTTDLTDLPDNIAIVSDNEADYVAIVNTLKNEEYRVGTVLFSAYKQIHG